MKIVVVGGTGLIGTKLVDRLQRAGEAVVAASRRNGIDAVTGERLDEVLAGADAVIDVSNPPRPGASPETGPEASAATAREFFARSTANLIESGVAAGVRHHIVLSIVGADRAPGDGYFEAKREQEQLVAASALPHTVLRATQFFEFAEQIADWNTTEDTIRLPATGIRPVATDDVVEALAGLVHAGPAAPAAAPLELGGPEELALDEFVRRVLLLHHDPRYIFSDAAARPIGFNLQGDVLLPDSGSLRGPTTLDAWIDLRRAREHAARRR